MIASARLPAGRNALRLEESGATVESIAAACGYGTTETMRRSFLRRLGTAAAEYRRRFCIPAPLSA